MMRHQLEHIIHASAGNADAKDIIVVGSQSILGSYPNAPKELLISIIKASIILERVENTPLMSADDRKLTHSRLARWGQRQGRKP